MSQRNPMNERYTVEDRTGKTRKSAASAKPKTKAASSVYVESTKKAPAKKGLFGSAKQTATTQTKKKTNVTPEQSRAINYPNTPEYKKWRRVWWILIVSAIVFTGISFLLQQYTQNVTITYVVLGLGYAALIAAVVVEFTKVRKERNKTRDVALSDKSKQATRARKAEKAEAAKKYEEAKTAEAEKAQDKKTSVLGGLFSGKKSDSADKAE